MTYPRNLLPVRLRTDVAAALAARRENAMIRLRRVAPTLLVSAAAATALTVPSPGGAAKEGDATASRLQGPARAVVSDPLAPPRGEFKDLRSLARARKGLVDDTWFSGLRGQSERPARKKHWQNRVPRKRMPRSVGKLYTLEDSSTIGECSAFTVRDPKFPRKRSFVVTAAHCLVDPKTKDWVDIAQFYPKFYGKRPKPYGRWDAKRMMVYDKWYFKGRWRFDIGVIRVERHRKKQIVDKVGGSRLAYGAKARDKRVRFIGYPAAGKFNGKFPYQCVGPSHRRKRNKHMAVMPCATREGASGGPWFKRMRNPQAGVAFATLSRGSTSGKRRIIIAPTFKWSLRRIAFKKKW